VLARLGLTTAPQECLLQERSNLTKGLKFIGRQFFSLKDPEKFKRGFSDLVESTNDDCGLFAADNLITWGKSLGWMRDHRLAAAFNEHAQTATERTIVWRTAVLAWAMRQALRVEGDLVECGCYKGTTARILYDAAQLATSNRTFYLYDLFDGAEGVAKHAMPEHGPDLEAQVRARFADLKNVTITRGAVPESLGVVSPQKIAFLHIDMNNREAEIGALETLFDRVTPGGVIVLDDFGWIAYEAQMQAERDWFDKRGYSVLELPTGQGVVIR
jgi:O-methyltransferase